MKSKSKTKSKSAPKTPEQIERAHKRLRIAIAKDVLASLKLLTAKRSSGYVVNLETGSSVFLEGKYSRKIAKTLKKECTVCAKGALLLSMVTLKNDFDFVDANHCSAGDQIAISSRLLDDRLIPTFSDQQLYDIEHYFEVLSLRSSRYVMTPKTALKTIMENIIANDGTFVLPNR